MPVFRISGVWKDPKGGVASYAFHTEDGIGKTRAIRKSKAEAIFLLGLKGNSATTWLWDFNQAQWVTGDNIIVLNAPEGKYLVQQYEDGLADLAHLPDYDWIIP